ncbi:hypothetical protein GQ600_20585 [Phytophthora cactorum]|nr:hypothetical protein GQ600_20585 [Phytophthora cactorum]
MVDEDYFPDEGTYVTEVPKRTKIDRERLFEEAFTDELRLEVGYFFMELDELMQSVWKAYVNVKREKRTMVEATVVVKLAMDAANTLTTQLQLKYPSLTTAKPLFNIVSPESFRRAMLGINDKFLQELKDSVEKSDGVVSKVLDHREVTVPVIFACICWMKSVAALQGNAGLGHNISLTFKHSTQLMKSIEFTVAKGTIRTVHEKTDAFLQRFGADIKNSTNLRYLARANPLLAGLMMLDRHFLYANGARDATGWVKVSLVWTPLQCACERRLLFHSSTICWRYTAKRFSLRPSSGNAWLLLSQILHSLRLRTAAVDAVYRGEFVPAARGSLRGRRGSISTICPRYSGW